jgi:hypothetical protein
LLGLKGRLVNFSVAQEQLKGRPQNLPDLVAVIPTYWYVAAFFWPISRPSSDATDQLQFLESGSGIIRIAGENPARRISRNPILLLFTHFFAGTIFAAAECY